MMKEQMSSPPRYGYAQSYRPSSPDQERTSRPKVSGFEYQASNSQPQDPSSIPSAHQLPRPTSMQPRYNASEPQRHSDSVPYPANPIFPPPRFFADNVRSPVFSSSFSPQAQMTGQRHNDGSGGGMYPPLTQSNTPTGNVYESRNAYGLHSSQPGSSSSLGPPGSLPWGQHTVTHVNVGAMAANTQQTSAAYQSSVSPVIPTGGMSFARPGGSKSNQTVDEEFDGRTRNAKAQKRHREKRKAHVKHLEETVLALQNHVRSLTRNQPLDPSGRPYLSPLTGGFPSQTELEDLSSRNVMLTEENQCLKAEVEHLRLKLSEPQGLSYPMSTSAPADMANRVLASGPIGVSNRTSSAITPISDDEPNRSLSLNLPSLTVNVKGEGVGQHYSPMDVTPTSSNPQMQSYGAAYGYSEPRRYYLSNIDQSPPLQPLSSGSSNLVQNPALGLSNVYHRYDVSQNHNTEGGAPSGFPPNLPSASLQPHSRQSGAMNNAVAGAPFSNQGAGGYALGPSAGGTSEKMAVPGILDGDSG